MKLKNRFDLIFTYWIFLWYLFYLLKIIPYNPTFALIMGFSCTLIIFLILLFYPVKWYIYLFVIQSLFLKLFFLYTVYSPIKKENIIQTGFFLLLYLFWLYLCKYTIYDIYSYIIYCFIHNKVNNTPELYLLKKYIVNIYE
jgi:hypothetical protein